MKPLVSVAAERELTEAMMYYAREGGAHIALALLSEFERVVNLLCINPHLGGRWRTRRQMPLRTFPYSVIYYVQQDDLRVVALAHHARRPHYWANRR